MGEDPFDEKPNIFTMFQAEPEEYSAINDAPKIPSYWNKWFPYEPVPFSPKLGFYSEKLVKGNIYHWCRCGECRTQPWCEDDGGPNGCLARGFTPMIVEPYQTGTQWLCGCKHCSSMPYYN